MKLKHIKYFEDYREALECWRRTTPSTIHSCTQGVYIVEWESECNENAQMIRERLFDIKVDYNLSNEQLDALAFADSAIKTLLDMGIIK